MSLRVWARLSQLRRCRFVGRTRERTLFQSVLRETQLSWQLLYIFGPGGIGKTTLLQEFVFICEQAKIPVIYIDVRNIEPTPGSFLSALQTATRFIPQHSLIRPLARIKQCGQVRHSAIRR
jgi:ABC-type cobalamin/Fe3+-siderophores transport system ATPase subunit